MLKNKLHIVSFDVPYPPDYGGAIDVFYKVKSLAEAGCEIYLHCFEYGRNHAEELEKYCRHVYYYKRNSGIAGISLSMPYIVYSRRDKELLKRLQEIDAPILFEGVHTTFFLSHPDLKTRVKAIRTHNVEHEYYALLAGKAPSLLLKIYYKAEAILLRKYERSLHTANAFLSLSLTDRNYFRQQYPGISSSFVPPFHPYDTVSSITGNGAYCLYHGNLSHPENREAVFFLLKEVIPNAKTQFIIAGKKPAKDMISACNLLSNCSIVPDPGNKEMANLIEHAHIHVLPAFQQSGMKLKLLSAMYGGRHVLVNEAMLFGTGLNDACHIALNGRQFADKINELMLQPFTEQDKQYRTAQLAPYDKANNANAVITSIMNA